MGFETFRCGHERSPENVKMVNKGRGRMVPQCVICSRKAKKISNAKRKAVYFEKRLLEVDAQELAKDPSKQPWNYLMVKPEAQDAWRDFSEALEGTKTNCSDRPELFSDYPEDNPPTEDEAIFMCGGCPLFDLCERFAELEQPTWGVWAGRTYGVDKIND